MGPDFSQIMKVKKAWDIFAGNHPKFPAFLQAVKNKGITEGTIIEAIITSPDGEKIETSLIIKESDLEVFRTLSQMK